MLPDLPLQFLRLLPHKKLSAWRKQFRKRGFTMEKIRDMLRAGRREVYTHPVKGNRYTKIYILIAVREGEDFQVRGGVEGAVVPSV